MTLVSDIAFTYDVVMRNFFIIPEGKPDAGYTYIRSWYAGVKWAARRYWYQTRHRDTQRKADKRYSKQLGISYRELRNR